MPTGNPLRLQRRMKRRCVKKKMLNARAQLLSAAPAEASPPTDPAAEVVDAASVPTNGTATLVQAAPAVTDPTIDQLGPQQATQRPVDVETLLAAGPPNRDAIDASVPAATSAAPAIPAAEQGLWELTATRAGLMLVGLGLVFLLGSLLASRLLDRKSRRSIARK